MIFKNLDTFFRAGAQLEETLFAKGPMALILLEDSVEVESTIEHHLKLGFKVVIAFGADDIETGFIEDPRFHRVYHDVATEDALCNIVNGVIPFMAGRWVYYGYNAEYLFYPFCEYRTIADLTIFSLEERRSSILTYVVDLYAGDLSQSPNGVCVETAHFDRGGYYALAREEKNVGSLEQQVDVYGGLRWRFEEHVRFERRRIDRVGLFCVEQGLELRADYTFNNPEYNTYSCPWHHSLSATTCSFRTTKALLHNPGSSQAIHSFQCLHSTPFEWSSQQLLDCGFMETGQWF